MPIKPKLHLELWCVRGMCGNPICCTRTLTPLAVAACQRTRVGPLSGYFATGRWRMHQYSCYIQRTGYPGYGYSSSHPNSSTIQVQQPCKWLIRARQFADPAAVYCRRSPLAPHQRQEAQLRFASLPRTWRIGSREQCLLAVNGPRHLPVNTATAQYTVPRNLCTLWLAR